MLDLSLAGPGSTAINTIFPFGNENETEVLEADLPKSSDMTACVISENCCCSLYQPAPLWLVEEKLRNVKVLREGNITSSSDREAYKRTCVFKMCFSLRMTP